MRNIFSFMFFFLAMCTIINAQELIGTVVDENNQPLAYTTIFIEELKTGTISNEKGEFSIINLERGTYRIRFQYLGYETQTKQIKFPNEKDLKIQLKPTAINLQEVVIKAKGEDPAYNIIRKAIAKAPYHENQLSYYKASVYSKSTGKIDDLSKFWKGLMKMSGDTITDDDFKGITTFEETVYDITHTPKETKQIVDAVNNYKDSTTEDLLGEYVPKFYLWDIYSQNKEVISPISHNALSYYNYELINSRITDGKKTYHIRVIPKKKNNALLTGTIDIIDSLWCVYHFDLTQRFPSMKMKSRIQVMFSELEKDIWVPVNYFVPSSFSMIGIKPSLTQIGSIQYLEYKKNPLDVEFVPIQEFVENVDIDSVELKIPDKYQKIMDDIAELSEKEELSKKDMFKLLRLGRKIQKEYKNNNQELFEEKRLEVDLFKNDLLIDADAYNRSPEYWSKKRTIPFTQEEIEFLIRKNVIKDSSPREDSLNLTVEQQEEVVIEKRIEKESLTEKKEETVEISQSSIVIDSTEKKIIPEAILIDTVQETNAVILADVENDSTVIEESSSTPITAFEEPQLLNDSINDSTDVRELHSAPTFLDIIENWKIKSRTKKYQFYLIGFRINFDTLNSFSIGFAGTAFNPVDGISIGINTTYKKIFENNKIWETAFDIQYAYASEHFPMEFHSSFNYLPKKIGTVSITAGRKSSDFNSSTGINPFMNQFASLFFKRNYVNYYDKKFIDLNHSIEAFNGFYIDAGFIYEEQQELFNNTNYSFFRKSKEYQNNFPEYNPYTSANADYVAHNTSAITRIDISYTPQMKYTFIKGQKVYLSSPYPTFSVSYQRGIKGIFNSSAEFEHWETSIHQNININRFSSFDYYLNGGIFTNNRNMHFSNFKHFGIYESLLMNTGLDYKFYTLKTYSASTNEWYLSGFFKYKTAYLSIKHLPFLQSSSINENIFVSYLRTPELKNYMEIGYALTEFLGMANAGVFFGFEDFKYNHWGIKFSLDIPVKETKEIFSLF